MTGKQAEILLGFEIGSGNPVHVPTAHTAVCGITQQSGKTTCLEAMVERTPEKRSAIAFVTKEAEGAFRNAHDIPPYFAERADWQFVEAILEATMRQKMKFERAWIMRVTRGASTLKEVQANVRTQMSKAHGLSADVYLQLSEYFKLIIPELGRVQMRSAPLDLRPGLNVMDLSGYSMQMQSLIISSTMSAIYRMRGVTIIIPEAWEFLPQQRNSPVKLAAEALIRKGAAAGNYVWLDSQDLSGVDKIILKQVSVWILGVQREINEVEHTLAQIPMPRRKKPQPEDIMRLSIGQFYVCFGDTVKKVYVRPAWLDSKLAQGYAIDGRGAVQIQAAARVAKKRADRVVSVEGTLAHVFAEEEEHVWKEKYDELKVQYDALKRGYDIMKARIDRLEDHAAPQVNRAFDAPIPRTESGTMNVPTVPTVRAVPSALLPGDEEALYQRFKARLFGDDGVTLQLAKLIPAIEYTENREVIRTDHSEIRGRIAELILDGYFSAKRSSGAVYGELETRGVTIGFKGAVGQELDKLTEMGFFRKEQLPNRSYVFALVPGVDERVKRSHAAA